MRTPATHTYAGQRQGDTDNASFTIDGDSLKTTTSIDYETKSSYFIRVKTDDGNGGVLEKDFVITVTDDTADNPVLNDLYANRVAITSGEVVLAVDNTNAGGDAGEPDSFGKAPAHVHSVWWKWTAANNGLVRISTEGSNFDTVLAVYTGTNTEDISTLNLVTINGDSTQSKNDNSIWLHNGNSMVEIDAISGTEYAIVVDGYEGQTGSVHLQVIDQNFPPLIRADGITVGVGAERSLGDFVEARCGIRAGVFNLHAGSGASEWNIEEERCHNRCEWVVLATGHC